MDRETAQALNKIEFVPAAEVIITTTVDWSRAPKNSRFFAVDPDGFGYFFDERPVQGEDGKWYGRLSPTDLDLIDVLWETLNQVGAYSRWLVPPEAPLDSVTVKARVVVHYDLAPEGAQFFRVDSDGTGYFYLDCPTYNGTEWIGTSALVGGQAMVDIKGQAVEYFSNLLLKRD